MRSSVHILSTPHSHSLRDGRRALSPASFKLGLYFNSHKGNIFTQKYVYIFFGIDKNTWQLSFVKSCNFNAYDLSVIE